MPLFTHPRYQKLRLDSQSSSEEGEKLIEPESSSISSSSISPNKSSSFFPPFSSNRGYFLLILTALFSLSLTILTIAVIILLLGNGHNSMRCSSSNPDPSSDATSPKQIYTSCGSSPAEALSRDCKFDILSFAWQTPECYDSELMSEFLTYPASGNLPSTSPNSDGWKFYTEDKTTNLSETVDLEVALKGERSLYVDWEFHVVHCTFMWRQMHRAFTVLGYIDGHLDRYAHTMHCQRTLLDRGRSEREVSVVAAVRYPECRSVHGRKRFDGEPKGGVGAVDGGY